MTTPHQRSSGAGLHAAPDALLISRAIDGDRHAFAVLVHRYGQLLRTYAARVLGHADAVDDVVQEVFLTAWQQLDALQDPAAIKPWLIRITTRTALQQGRRFHDHDDVGDHDPPAAAADEPDRVLETATLGRALQQTLDRLPETQRRAWTLKEVGGYSYDEIAAELGLPVSTIRGALSRARRTLITDLDGWRQP